MLVMGCKGNVGVVVSRAVVESQDGVSGTGRRGWVDDDGWMDSERGERGCLRDGCGVIVWCSD